MDDATGYNTWSAQWIWQEECGPANIWMCFRKTFNAMGMEGSFIAKIAADSKYWLWVNEKPVVIEGGLKRGPNPSDTYYDTVDISSYLVTGKNVVAVLVWYWGRSGTSNNDSGKGGFLLES